MPAVVLLDADEAQPPMFFFSVLCEGWCGRTGWVSPDSFAMPGVEMLCQHCYALTLSGERSRQAPALPSIE